MWLKAKNNCQKVSNLLGESNSGSEVACEGTGMLDAIAMDAGFAALAMPVATTSPVAMVVPSDVSSSPLLWSTDLHALKGFHWFNWLVIPMLKDISWHPHRVEGHIPHKTGKIWRSLWNLLKILPCKGSPHAKAAFKVHHLCSCNKRRQSRGIEMVPKVYNWYRMQLLSISIHNGCALIRWDKHTGGLDAPEAHCSPDCTHDNPALPLQIEPEVVTVQSCLEMYYSIKIKVTRCKIRKLNRKCIKLYFVGGNETNLVIKTAVPIGKLETSSEPKIF